MNQYTANTLVRLVASIVTVDNLPIDATDMVARVKIADGTVADISSSIIRDDVGKYHVDYLATTVGLIMYEWIATGAVEVTGFGQFIITQDIF